MKPELPALVERVLARLDPAPGGRRVLIGIAGMPGAGKSTLAADLVDALRSAGTQIAHVPMDGFHLADVELGRLGLSSRKGSPASFDAAGYVALLRRLREAGDEIVYAPAFERDLDQPLAGAIPVPSPARVVVTEGNYLLLDGAWAGVRRLLDEIWYVETENTVRRNRLLARHVEFGRSAQDAADWMAGNDDLNAAEVGPTAALADLRITLS